MIEKKKTEGIILHNIDDAGHCIEKGLFKERLLFSTHTSVNVYLKENYNIDCHFVGEYLTSGDLLEYRTLVSQIVVEVISILDQNISPILNAKYGTKMRFFSVLYSYVGRHHLLGVMSFIKSITIIKEKFGINKFLIYDLLPATFINSNKSINHIVERVISRNEFVIINRRQSLCHKVRHRLKSLLRGSYITRMRLRTLATICYLKILRLWKMLVLTPKAALVVYSPQRKWMRLEKWFASYQFINARTIGKAVESYDTSEMERCFDLVAQNNRGDIFKSIIVADIKNDIRLNIVRYLGLICALQDIHRKTPITMGLWDNPPISKDVAIIFEYLLSNNIDVVGVQHGGVYGTSFLPWLIYADFMRCNAFITYGATYDDYSRVYSNYNMKCKILPTGFVKRCRPVSKKKGVDIVFPVTNSMSIFKGGMSRIPPHELTQRQVDILRYLNQLEGVNVCVKCCMGTNASNCSILPVLEKCNNLKVVNNCTLVEYLSRFSPRIAIIEFNSSPLYEMLTTDAEIFLMSDNVHPFEDEAMKKLKERVHVSDNTLELIEMVDSYLNGSLPSRRGNSFYEHYESGSISETQLYEMISEYQESKKKDDRNLSPDVPYFQPNVLVNDGR